MLYKLENDNDIETEKANLFVLENCFICNIIVGRAYLAMIRAYF